MRQHHRSQLGIIIDWIIQRSPWVIVLRLYNQAARLILGRPLYRYAEVAPGVYVGGQHRKHGWEAMRKAGIGAVVNMRREYDDRKGGVASERYLHLPTTDNHPPTIEDLQKGVEFIHNALSSGHGVYIHCGMGVGRAPTMAAAYLIKMGMEPKQAWRQIRRVRPFIWPMPGQYRIIEVYADSLRGDPRNAQP